MQVFKVQLFTAFGNQIVSGRVGPAYLLCKETATWLTNIARRPNATLTSTTPSLPTTCRLSSVGSWWLSLWSCGLFLATARRWERPLPTARLKTARQIRGPLTPRQTLALRLRLTRHRLQLLRQTPARQLRQPKLHQQRLLILLRQPQHLPLPQPTRNFSGLRALSQITLLGGHLRVPALLSFSRTVGPALFTKNSLKGMTLC